MHDIDVGDLQRDVAPAAGLTNRIDGRGAVFFEKNEALSETKRRTARPGLFGEAEDIAIELPMFAEASDPMATAIWVTPSCPGGTNRTRLPSGSTRRRGSCRPSLAMISSR